MAIPKHLRKQIKKDFRSNPDKRVGRQRTWSYEVGDLVKLKREECWGVVIEQLGSFYSIMTPGGQRNIYPGNLERVQPLVVEKTNKKDI